MSEKKSLKRKITTKSLEEKYKALKDIENGVAKKEVATKYSIPLNTLSMWVKDKEKISSAFENGKSPKTMKLKGAGAMFVTGKSARPRCFAGVRNLPCRY